MTKQVCSYRPRHFSLPCHRLGPLSGFAECVNKTYQSLSGRAVISVFLYIVLLDYVLFLMLLFWAAVSSVFWLVVSAASFDLLWGLVSIGLNARNARDAIDATNAKQGYTPLLSLRFGRCVACVSCEGCVGWKAGFRWWWWWWWR